MPVKTLNDGTDGKPVIKAIPLEAGALCGSLWWHSDYRAKNWLAAIDLDPRAPSGLARTFVPLAKGNTYFYVDNPDVLTLHTPVEFGAKGHRDRHGTRRYAIIIERTADQLTFEVCETGRAAVLRARELRAAAEQDATRERPVCTGSYFNDCTARQRKGSLFCSDDCAIVWAEHEAGNQYDREEIRYCPTHNRVTYHIDGRCQDDDCSPPVGAESE